MIIPLIINPGNKIISDFSPLDYYDIITCGSKELFIRAIEWLLAKYPGYKIFIRRLNEESKLFQWHLPMDNSTDVCVRIPLTGRSYEDYFSSLSKHQRQNIRTAYNRLEKAGISIRIETFSKNKAIPNSIKKSCLRIYEKRTMQKSSYLSPWRVLLHRWTMPIFKSVVEMDASEMIVLFLDTKPAAFMAGALSQDGKMYTVPILSSSMDYMEFSPGIVLVNEAIKHLISDGLSVLDLARGNESYKYAMGGIDFYNHIMECNALIDS